MMAKPCDSVQLLTTQSAVIWSYLYAGPGAIFSQNHEDSGAIRRRHIDIVLQDGGAPEDPTEVLLGGRWCQSQWSHVTQLQAIRTQEVWAPVAGAREARESP